ncbi:protein BEX4 [Sorex araneus]|uniref:protein BEX4 n=1 Tax=Sorex araneus TaxID=42254 RepID=UPI000157FA2A|nr:protein BEX4 [Sorex araneus]XP_054976615.1 protein BEX4 [Sorex araneus]
MTSKEKKMMKNLSKENENANPEKEEGKESPAPNGEESRPLGGGEVQKSGGKLGRVRRFVPSFRWALPSRQNDQNEAGDDVDKFAGKMMEVKRKSKEQQLKHYTRFQTPEPDNHYDFCLIP